MNKYDSMVENLLRTYREIREKIAPEGAVHQRNTPEELVVPTIPFVGKHYAEQEKKILVYASAEVLSDYYPGSQYERPWLDDNNQAENRHRIRFEATKGDGNFFPNVHIQPMNDGTLATAVLYIAKALMPNLDIDGLTPAMFYEQIAFGNYSKYTTQTEQQRSIFENQGINGSDKNVDPTQMPKAKAQEWLQYSRPYLKADIETLQPDIIILPEKLYNIDKQGFDEITATSNIAVIGIYQLGPIPINCTISTNPDYKVKKALHQTFHIWCENIARVSKDNYRCVFNYLDKKVLSSLKEEQ